MEWKNLYRGFIMGISDLIPGVSGGTIAVILGIYDRLLDAISGFFSKRWKEQLGFLIPLAVGMGTALLLLSRLIEFLLENYHEPTQFFFIGLIIGVIPLMLKQAQPKKNFGSRHYIILALAAILIASMAFLNPEKTTEPITSLSLLSVIGLFFSGWLASMAMLLPGISGSFILLLLGVYSTAINALSTLNIPVILVIGLGAVVGFIGSSKGIKYSLSHFPHITYAIIIGLILGSLFVVFPGMVTGITTLIFCLITFILGLSVTMLFGSEKKLIKGKSDK
ncbi:MULTISPECIES: DUF368 domain-containing protein [Bacillaceae]|jgi:putative membrane protein|uniref:DUF368 domain-containing protein n=1 Tax=Niallia hominis TaxID=3133173 RepID=A0ABV1F062_9BACI|nr:MULTISPECIES: DUF368 domain-containing protein [Bacillaceae]MCF2647881.1 DUF368 domain-containing protein [Niallia circulans]CAI9394081.1 hypothetical protein BACSP_00698 [Bacillus sp. T2.9-1]